MKVCFETFGCRLNKAEALQMEAEYLAKGWELTDKHSDADLFVVRGCSVTARAQAECEKLIAHLRQRHPNTPMKICGCLKLPNGTPVTHETHGTSGTNEVISKPPHHRTAAALSGSTGFEITSNETVVLPARTARAYLKVQDGCSGKCTFCIVPKFRGDSVSVPYTELLDKAKRFIESGYHEIVVTGCNLSLYASEGKRLPDLLAALAEFAPSLPEPSYQLPTTSYQLPTTSYQLPTSSCRIRLGSLEPGACALETVHVLAEHANICRFLHIPVQTGADRILTAMRRPYRIHDVDALVSSATRLLPELGLGCDLMTGFPGESDLDFEATKDLLSRLPFNNAHVFPYSERPGTPAADFSDAVPAVLRSVRANELAKSADKSRQLYAKTFIGKTVEIVVEDKDKTVGWTGEYLRCEAVGTAPRKSLVRVHVTDVRGDRLAGRLA